MSTAGHRHIEDLENIAWYRARFPDRGAGNTKAHAYIQADSEEAARNLAADHEHFDMYDTSKGTVERLGPSWSEIENGFKRAGGPNVLIDQLGNLRHRRDE